MSKLLDFYKTKMVGLNVKLIENLVRGRFEIEDFLNEPEIKIKTYDEICVFLLTLGSAQEKRITYNDKIRTFFSINDLEPYLDEEDKAYKKCYLKTEKMFDELYVELSRFIRDDFKRMFCELAFLYAKNDSANGGASFLFKLIRAENDTSIVSKQTQKFKNDYASLSPADKLSETEEEHVFKELVRERVADSFPINSTEIGIIAQVKNEDYGVFDTLMKEGFSLQ